MLIPDAMLARLAGDRVVTIERDFVDPNALVVEGKEAGGLVDATFEEPVGIQHVRPVTVVGGTTQMRHRHVGPLQCRHKGLERCIRP